MASTMLASKEQDDVQASSSSEHSEMRRRQLWDMFWRCNDGRFDGFNVVYDVATGAQVAKHSKVRHFDASELWRGGHTVHHTNTDTFADGTTKAKSWEYQYERDMLDNGMCPRLYLPSARCLQIPSGGNACANEAFNSYSSSSSSTSRYTDMMELFFHGYGLKTQQRNGARASVLIAYQRDGRKGLWLLVLQREDTNGWPSPLFAEDVPDTNDTHAPSRALPDVSVGNWSATVETVTAALEYLDVVGTTQPLAFNSHVRDPRLPYSDTPAYIRCTELHTPDGFSMYVPEEVPPEPVAAAATATWVLPGGNEVQKISVTYSQNGELAALSKAVYYRTQ